MVPRTAISSFPPNDPVALFVIAMCEAANDIRDADALATAARDPSDPESEHHRKRFSYRVRMVNGHLFEGIAALKSWRQTEPGVRKLLAGLSKEGKLALSTVMSVDQKIGGKAMEAVRHNSFHYPHPGGEHGAAAIEELAEAIRVNPDLEADVDVADEGRLSYRFVDQLALSVAFGAYDQDEDRRQKQIRMVHTAAQAFVRLVEETFANYLLQRDVGFEIEE